MEGVQGYNKDQIALVVSDLLKFVAQVPIILGSPTISHVVNVIKEREVDDLAMLWANALVAHLLLVQRAMATVKDSQTAGMSSPSECNEVVVTKIAETIDAFSSHVIPMKAERIYARERISVMTQALQAEDGLLPQGLTIQYAYMELKTGSKNTVVVVRNSTAYPYTLKKKTPIAEVVAATAVPEPPVTINLPEGVAEPHSLQAPKLTIRQRQGRLFEELDLSGLKSRPLELADSTQLLLAKYHNVFSLDPSEVGCTHSTEYVIKVMDDTPFKERFR